MKKLFLKIALFTILSLTLPTISAFAQCPMCKMAAESNMKNGGTAGKGLNTGILYMFVMPYLLVGSLAYLWWRNRKKQLEESKALAEEAIENFSQN